MYYSLGSIPLLLGFFANVRSKLLFIFQYPFTPFCFLILDSYHLTPCESHRQVSLSRTTRRQKTLFLQGKETIFLRWRIHSQNIRQSPLFQCLSKIVDGKKFKEVDIKPSSYRTWGSQQQQTNVFHHYTHLYDEIFYLPSTFPEIVIPTFEIFLGLRYKDFVFLFLFSFSQSKNILLKLTLILRDHPSLYFSLSDLCILVPSNTTQTLYTGPLIYSLNYYSLLSSSFILTSLPFFTKREIQE